MIFADETFPTLRDLACELGQVQIQWSFLETEMRRQLATSDGPERPFRGPIIARWRVYAQRMASEQKMMAEHLDAVEPIARTRNLLAHGIEQVSADPRTASTAFIVCVDSEGVKNTLTIDEIRELSVEIDRVRRSMWLGRSLS